MVEDLVADPFEADRRAAVAAFGRVVEDDIQDHPDAGTVQGLDQIAKLVAGVRRIEREAGMRREEAVGAVAPVVLQAHGRGLRRNVLGVEGHDRHQLDMGDPQVLQIRDLFDHGAEGAGVRDPGRGMAREAAGMHLVDDRGVQRDVQGRVALPVVAVAHHLRADCGGDVVPRTSGDLATPQPIVDRDGPGVEECLLAVHPTPDLAGIAGPVDAPVVEDSFAQTLDEDVPEKEGSIDLPIQRDDLVGLGAGCRFEEQQLDLLGIAREDAEVHPLVRCPGTGVVPVAGLNRVSRLRHPHSPAWDRSHPKHRVPRRARFNAGRRRGSSAASRPSG